jgi:hypothetical protein
MGALPGIGATKAQAIKIIEEVMGLLQPLMN